MVEKGSKDMRVCYLFSVLMHKPNQWKHLVCPPPTHSFFVFNFLDQNLHVLGFPWLQEWVLAKYVHKWWSAWTLASVHRDGWTRSFPSAFTSCPWLHSSCKMLPWWQVNLDQVSTNRKGCTNWKYKNPGPFRSSIHSFMSGLLVIRWIEAETSLL